LAGESAEAIGRTINLAQGAEVTINELAAKLLAAVGRPDGPVLHVEARPGDVHRLLGDPGLARRLLHWWPTADLEAGLGRLVEWHAQVRTDWAAALQESPDRNWEVDLQ